MRALVVRCHDWNDNDSFEPVIAAVEEHATGVEILRPGVLALAARGPASYYRTEAAAAERIVDAVAEAAEVECAVGIADSLFAAWLASHRGLLVETGQSAEFLREIDIAALGRPELTAVLRRLGIYTLGAFAELPAAEVADRFGADAAFAQRLAAGEDIRPPVPRTPAADLTVSVDCDPPLERIDVAAFTARALAVQLHRLLDAHGLSCSRLLIEATIVDGVQVSRTWRHDGTLTAEAITDRVRWQLDGWLSGGAVPAGGIVALSLTPDGLLPQTEAQPGLWGASGPTESRAGRAMVRVQGLLGGDAVLTAVPDGGRGLSERVRLVPWGEPRQPRLSPAEPWPGALPPPVPTVISHDESVTVRDAEGNAVGVTGRHMLTAPPATVSGTETTAAVAAWSGPWVVAERWWDDRPHRYARLQVCLSDDSALLLKVEQGQWWVEGRYD